MKIRFSIRSLLVLTAVVALGLACTPAIQQYRMRRFAEKIVDEESQLAITRAQSIAVNDAYGAQADLLSLRDQVGRAPEMSTAFRTRLLRQIDNELGEVNKLCLLQDCKAYASRPP